MGFRHHVADLVHGAGYEVHKLKFGNWTHAGQRSAKSRTDNCRFSDRRINHAPRTEAIDKAFSNFERASVNPDVFADAKNGGIAFHFFRYPLANSFKISEYGHKSVRPD